MMSFEKYDKLNFSYKLTQILWIPKVSNIQSKKNFSSCLLSAVKWISLWWSGLVCSCSRFLTFYKFPLEL